MQQLVWIAVIAGAIVLALLPIITAVIRGTEQIWIVVVLTMLTPLSGVTWFAAWWAAFALPRHRAAPQCRPAPPRQPALPPWDDPKCLYGGVPSADTAVVSRRQAGAEAGVSVWS
jgi:hypothetical protein